MTHLAEEQLVAYRCGYAEADETLAIENHLRECERCRAGLDAIDATLAAAAQVPVPDRSEGYGAEVWARIQPRLERPVPSWRAALQSLFVPRRLAFAGGVAVLVLAAFVAGRYVQTGSRPGTPGQGQSAQQAQGAASGKEAAASPQVRREILLVAVGDHLERSQITLAELVNSSNAADVDISNEQDRARDLVVENRLYRQTAQETGDPTLAAALDDLERVLVEVANSPSQLSKSEFEHVRDRIESQGIMFKVRVLGEQVREQQIRSAAGGRIQG